MFQLYNPILGTTLTDQETQDAASWRTLGEAQLFAARFALYDEGWHVIKASPDGVFNGAWGMARCRDAYGECSSRVEEPFASNMRKQRARMRWTPGHVAKGTKPTGNAPLRGPSLSPRLKWLNENAKYKDA